MWIFKISKVLVTLSVLLTITSVPLRHIQASPSTDQSTPMLCHADFSPDGRKIVSSTDNGHVRLWDLETGTVQYEFKIAEGCGNLVFTPDSQMLFTSQLGSNLLGADAVTILWDLQTGKELRRFIGGANFSEDGQLILTSKVPDQLWNASTGDLLHTYDQPLHASLGGVFSPDNQKLATVNYPVERAELWEVKTGKLLFTFPQQQPGWISIIQFLPDNERVLIGNANNDVALWNLNTLTIERTFKDTADAPTFHFYSNNDVLYMVTYSYDNKVQVWNVQTGKLLISFLTDAQIKSVTDSAVSSDGKQLLIGLREGVSQLWDLENGMLIRSYFPPESTSVDWVNTRTQVKFSPDNQNILISYSNEALHLWNLKKGTELVYDAIQQ